MLSAVQVALRLLSFVGGELPVEGKIELPFYARLATNGRFTGALKLHSADQDRVLIVAEALLSIAGQPIRRHAVIALEAHPADERMARYWSWVVKDLRPDEIARAANATGVVEQIAVMRAVLEQRRDSDMMIRDGYARAEASPANARRAMLGLVEEDGRVRDQIVMEQKSTALDIHVRGHRISVRLPE